MSHAWPERGASAIKLFKTRCRSCLKNDMLNAMLHIKITGPALGNTAFKPLIAKAVQMWLDAKGRKKLPRIASVEGNSQIQTIDQTQVISLSSRPPNGFLPGRCMTVIRMITKYEYLLIIATQCVTEKSDGPNQLISHW